jgi:hypothetical protein
MALIQGQVGPQTNGPNSSPVLRALYSGELGVADVHARYQEAQCRQNVYCLFSTAQNPTGAFPFAAAGTPLIGLINPTGSGKNLVLLGVGLSIQTTGTAAVTTTFGLTLTGLLVTGSGTVTNPTNMYTCLTTGSVAKGYLNTAMTSNTIQGSIVTLPIVSIGLTATTAVTNPMPALYDVAGLIVMAPGTVLALGVSATLTAAKVDSTLIWEEIPSAS